MIKSMDRANILKNKILFFFGMFSVFCVFLSPAQGLGGTGSNETGISLDIRYYDKKIYYLQNNPVFIRITISNNTPELYRFRLAEERPFSVDFDTRSLANRPLEPSDILQRKRSTAGTIFFRDLTLESGESFSFVENLCDYAAINSPGDYIIQVKLYPDLLDKTEKQQSAPNGGTNENSLVRSNQKRDVLISNRLALHIKAPSIIGDDGLPVALDIETNAPLAREALAPDQVITWTLTARQKSQWEKFFLYLNMEKMLARDGASARQWQAESEEGRLRMLANYRNVLQKSTIDGDIASIPMDFKIERTSYDGGSGTVVVLERFKVGDYISRKRYTYYLEKEDSYWQIVDYVVLNLGTE